VKVAWHVVPGRLTDTVRPVGTVRSALFICSRPNGKTDAPPTDPTVPPGRDNCGTVPGTTCQATFIQSPRDNRIREQARTTLPGRRLLDRAHRQSSDKLPGNDDTEYDYRKGNHGSGGHDLPPGQIVTTHKTSRHHRSGLGVFSGENQRVEQLVPGKDKAEDRRDSNTGRHQRQADLPENGKRIVPL